MNCCKCPSSIAPTQDAVSCIGCSRNFHASCEFSGSSTEIRGVLAILRLRQNIHFLCDCCKSWIIDSNIGVLIDKVNRLSAASPDISKIEDDIATNRKLIESLAAKLDVLSTSVSSSIPSSSRLKSKSMTPKDLANNPVSNNNNVVSPPWSLVAPPVNTFGTCADKDLKAIEVPHVKHLYVSRLDPSTSAEQVVEYICKKVEHCKAADLVCRNLLKKDRSSEQSLTFISFKIAVPAKFFDSVSDPSIWPQNVLVREFIQKSENFRAQTSNFPKL